MKPRSEFRHCFRGLTGGALRRVVVRLFAATVITVCPIFAWAGPCNITWNGAVLAQRAQERSPEFRFRLLDTKKQQVAVLTGAQILAISEAREAVAEELGRSSSLIFCSDTDPNAFATKTPNGEVVGVTVGLATLLNGDRDMAAMVIGHEYAHLVLGHLEAAVERRELFALLGEIAGALLEYKTGLRTRPGAGMNIGVLGASLISYKFDRDQERQADEAGFRYMVEAGFSPLGAVRLAETMQRNGAGGIGLFFDNHPGWPERTARFQALIKASPQAQAAVARIGARTELATTSAAASQTQVALSPAYQATDAEKTFADGIAAFSRRDFQMGVKAIRSSAALGYAPAQRELAYLYGGGLAGLSKDEVEAVRLYRLAAEQSDARALNNLAVMYSQGRGGLPLDDVEALRLYREAATKGDSTALLNLGHLYQDGKGGVQKDVSVAKNYYQQSADAGNGDALAQVGLLYQYGGAGESDIPKAVTLYRESANNGSALGQYRLARCYLDGIGIQKDEVEAAKWLQLAATQGNAEALIVLPEEQPKLGEMYLRGQGGLTKNPMEALRLFQASAAQGNAEGEFWLGSMYELGDAGLPVDKEKAANWYRKAAAQGHAKAAERLSNMGTRP